MHGCVQRNFVIPEPAEGRNPESRHTLRGWFWIPGSLASRAPRNDRSVSCTG